MSPAYKTIWFLPLVIALYVYAKINNTLKGKFMTAKQTSIERNVALFIARALRIKRSKARNPDWARVDEPDFILPSLMYYVIGVPLIPVLAMLAYAVLNGSLADSIAPLLLPLAGPFEERLALFAAGVVIMLGVMVTLFVSITHKPDGDDLVEMLSDHDENILERLAEVEETINKRIDSLISEGPVVLTHSPEDMDIAERIGG